MRMQLAYMQQFTDYLYKTHEVILLVVGLNAAV